MNTPNRLWNSSSPCLFLRTSEGNSFKWCLYPVAVGFAVHMESWDHMCICRGRLSPASFLWQKTYAASSNTRDESKAHVGISTTVGIIPFHPQWTNLTTMLSVTSATINSKGVSNTSAILGTALLSMQGHCRFPTVVSLFNKWRNGDSETKTLGWSHLRLGYYLPTRIQVSLIMEVELLHSSAAQVHPIWPLVH